MRNNSHPTISSRGRRDAPATELTDYLPLGGRSNPNSTAYPDMLDGQYSSDESESPILAEKHDCSDQTNRIAREPPPDTYAEGWRNHPPRNTRQATSSVQKQDPPDETFYSHRIDNQREVKNNSIQGYNQYSYREQHRADRITTNHGPSGNSTRTGRNSSPHDYLSSNRSASRGLHTKRISANDFPLIDDEEDLYEQYQDELFRKQPLVQPQPMSSQYGQFSIAPLVEMSPLHGKKSKKQNQQQKSKSHQHLDDFKWQSRPSTGRYSRRDCDESEDDVEHDIDDMLDKISGTGKHHKTNEKLYNFNDEQDEESDDDDYDEERPLRRSTSSSSIYIQRSNVPTALSRTETCLNRTLALVIALLSLVFIRDHTPWWKKYQSRVAMEKYENERTSDPMKVYNTNDDDSTKARDHDPLNLYKDITAGKRISDRPAEKR